MIAEPWGNATDSLEGIRCPLNPSEKVGITPRLVSAPSRLVSALREPCSSRFPSGVPARRAERRLAMATATKRIPAGHAELSQPAVPALTAARGEYHCECGHTLRAFGLGRHRLYYEPGDTRLNNPVMNRACPECGRGLQHKRGQ